VSDAAGERVPARRWLVTGWFSFVDGEITAGDLACRDLLCRWLDEEGAAYDAAMSPLFDSGGLRLEDADPAAYTDVVFVCGPAHGVPVDLLLERFGHCRRVAVNVSVVGETARRFDAVVERDGDGPARPDLSLLRPASRVPVVGVMIGHPQGEYGDRGRHDVVEAAVRHLLASADVAAIPLDTRLDTRDALLPSTPDQVEAVLGRLDALVTARLHGLVLALKQGVPALAVDPIAGGAKVAAQAAALGWPAVVRAEELSASRLQSCLRWCLGDAARRQARACHREALTALCGVEMEVRSAVVGLPGTQRI
jgi:Polysaccharide pyruvyl transferase